MAWLSSPKAMSVRGGVLCSSARAASSFRRMRAKSTVSTSTSEFRVVSSNDSIEEWVYSGSLVHSGNNSHRQFLPEDAINGEFGFLHPAIYALINLDQL